MAVPGPRREQSRGAEAPENYDSQGYSATIPEVSGCSTWQQRRHHSLTNLAGPGVLWWVELVPVHRVWGSWPCSWQLSGRCWCWHALSSVVTFIS